MKPEGVTIGYHYWKREFAMFTLLIVLGLLVVMLVLGMGTSVLWMRPSSRQPDVAPRRINTIEAGSMPISGNDQACAA